MSSVTLIVFLPVKETTTPTSATAGLYKDHLYGRLVYLWSSRLSAALPCADSSVSVAGCLESFS